MTARDMSRREIKEEMEDGGFPGLEEWQAGAGVGVDNPGGARSDSRAAAAAVPGPEASGRDNVRSVAQCGGAHGGWRADQAPKYSVLSEYARDQFVRAIEPRDLRERVQLRHPSTLQEALELALEREELRGGTTQGGVREASPTVRVAVESSPAREQPEWVGAMMERMTELVRAVTLQPQGGAARSPGPMRCWGCGRTGHRLTDCRDHPEKQGNGRGSV
ncbi:hypothetical protein AAFF_G00057600 [Aldrovandia affinis]|uniref:CCHC-type domain-containing protein n=1 Tax=Aldrovandia affinis TaxID=143900 RepID=A0AAD7S0I1_9TELE|nr:hypothetical protein AAFF_G00057600 [Aldrovandia affinis]